MEGDGPDARVEWRQGVTEVGPAGSFARAGGRPFLSLHVCACQPLCVATWGRVLFILTCPGREAVQPCALLLHAQEGPLS